MYCPDFFLFYFFDRHYAAVKVQLNHDLISAQLGSGCSSFNF